MPHLIADFWTEVANKFGASIAALTISTVLSFTLGRWWGRYRARRDWQAKQFLGRVIVSLNSFVGDTLRIRTVFERSLDQLFLHPHAVELVTAAAQRTTKETPLLPIAKEDRWYILNFVLNAVAEQFAAGAMRLDAGESVKAVAYALCLTCEANDELRVKKVRAMLIRHDLLANFPYMETMPTLEQPWHDVRIYTLRHLARAYRADPGNFLTLEVCV